MNTVVGFACSMGVDMGFNSNHHGRGEANGSAVHVHADGKRHVHLGNASQRPLIQNVASKAAVHIHKDGNRHLHTDKKVNEHPNNGHRDDKRKTHHEKGSDKDNCCNDKVRKFDQLDKTVPQVVKIIHPVFYTAFVASFYKIQVLPPVDIVKDIKRFVRSYHPPIQDLRIAIQSFQI